MESNSLSSAQFELEEATDLLTEALDADFLELHCYGDESVLYETLDGTYIHANYKVEGGNLTFENVQELVVDEDTEKAEAKKLLGTLLDSILEDEEAKAGRAFEQYLALPNIKRDLLEGETGEEDEELNEDVSQSRGGFRIRKSKPTKRGFGRGKRQSRALVAKRVRGRKRSLKRISPGLKQRASRERKKFRRGLGGNKRARVVVRYNRPTGLAAMKTEQRIAVSNLVENVTDYLNYKELGPVLKNLLVKHDDKGNVIALRVPTTEARNQSRLLSFKWNVLDHESKIMRSASKSLGENQDFCKAVAELKRNNALSDNDAMTDNLEAIATNWPDVIYLTHAELSEVVSTALKTAGVTNWDDEIAAFLAEGILRKIHSSYTDRVDKILKLAGVSAETKDEEDAFEKFQEVVERFYPTLDESVVSEMQVFVDLYNSVRDIHEIAARAGDEIVAEEATGYLRDLHAVVSKDVESDLTLAEEVTLWLGLIIETNLETQSWNVNNKPHMTVSGDHPDMAQKAGKSYSPRADGTGDWGDKAPVSDGKSYRGGLADEMRNRSWGNIGGPDTYPSVRNPYTPEPFGDYTMKGEKGVDKANSGFSLYRGQTWPELQNPYTPDAPGQDGWKMKADNLVIDK